jgi:hypothetical protein
MNFEARRTKDEKMQGPDGGFRFKISRGLGRSVQRTLQTLEAAAIPIVASTGPIPP